MYEFLLWLVMIVYYILGCLCITLLIKFLDFPSRERGSLEDGILQRIKNSLSSFHLHFILLRSLISYEQIPHQLWPFSGKIKTPLHLMCRLLAIYLTILSDLELLQEIRVIGHTSWAFWQIGEMAPTS